jgi:kumamolisin
MARTLVALGFLISSTLAVASPPDQHFYSKKGEFIIPGSSISSNADVGQAMHTYQVIFKPAGSKGSVPHASGETPASMACIYGLTPAVPGCPINGTTALPTGGWGAIALVDAYDNPNAENDLNVFSAQFGLPACTTANGCFSVVYSGGNHLTPPAYDEGWADEHVLDIEWAHAMAPNAKIILVETPSGSNDDLFAGVAYATQQVLAAGGGEVSNSWGSSEFAGENIYDTNFQNNGLIYFASSGDYSAPARYPSSSPYVISAGGTSITRDSNGNFVSESAWSQNPDVPIGSKSGSSGGPSLYESRPAFQNSIAKLVGGARGTPDISFDADPSSGVDVYSTVHGGWLVDGGTSVSSPALAGIINAAGLRANNTTTELMTIYGNSMKNYHSFWHDILMGNNGFPCMSGYDFVTGLGSPLGYSGK